MTLRLPQRLPDPNAAWFDPKTGNPTPLLVGYMREVDFALRKLVGEGAPVAVAELQSAATMIGQRAFASDGRKAGEGAGLGSGVLVFSDGAHWIAVDTGATVAA